MPTSSEKPTILDLSLILEGLLEAGIKFILVGGLAAVVQGAPVTTMDVDIVHNRSSENLFKLIAFLKSIDATYRRPDDKLPVYGKLGFQATEPEQENCGIRYTRMVKKLESQSG